MAGKRRAEGSASTRPSKQAPKSTQKQSFFTKARALKAFKWGGITGLVMALIGVGGFLYLYNAIDVPDANADFKAERTVVTYAGGKQELGRFAVQDRDVIPYDEMPQTIKDAVVAAENRSFWTDNGIDVKGILRAALNNASGNSTEGASTITQQLVKILYLNQEQSYTRKVKEAILALKIHRQISKEQVLTDYLNTIYFGRGAYGIEAAAEAYFRKNAKDLNLRQSAFLASVLNDPNDLDPADGKDARLAVKDRYRYTLGSMAAIEAVPSDEAEKAQKKLPKFPKQDAANTDTYGGQKGHLLAMVRAELYRLGYTDDEIDRGGLKIETTFTENDMKAAEEGVIAGRPDGFGDKQLHVGAAIVEPGTGAVRGFYGGQDYLQSQLNWAVRGGQAGSTFKPFAVATALDQGYSLKSTFEGNSPLELPDGSDVENQGDQDYGSRVSLLKATESSINTAFVDLTQALDDGPESIIEMANQMGIPPAKATRKIRGFPNRTPGLEANLGVALGSQTVSPINMANGYATIANGGEAAEPYIIEKVESAEGTWTHKVKTHEAFSPEIASDVSYAMQQVVKAGSGTAALALGRPAAGKTGTATRTDGAVSSAWFAGFTPQRSTAVMYVRGKGVGQLDGWLPSYFGGDYPAETWTEIMTRAMDGLPIEEFPEPALLEERDPPSEDHAPYTPPPPPKTKEPKTTEPTEPTEPTKPPKTSKPPKPTEPTEPTEPTTPSDCEFLGNCETDDGNNGGGNDGGGGQGRQVVATRETSAQRASLLA